MDRVTKYTLVGEGYANANLKKGHEKNRVI